MNAFAMCFSVFKIRIEKVNCDSVHSDSSQLSFGGTYSV